LKTRRRQLHALVRQQQGPGLRPRRLRHCFAYQLPPLQPLTVRWPLSALQTAARRPTTA